MTLTEFLLARIAEDEAEARAADTTRWHTEDKTVTFTWTDRSGEWDYAGIVFCDTKANMYHIANWDPARVLAECDAKRRIVERYRQFADREYQAETLRLLATPYADHPDYQEEWTP